MLIYLNEIKFRLWLCDPSVLYGKYTQGGGGGGIILKRDTSKRAKQH